MEIKKFTVVEPFLYFYPLNWKSFVKCVQSIHEGLIDIRPSLTALMVPDVEYFTELVVSVTSLYALVNYRHIYSATGRSSLKNVPSNSAIKEVLERVRIPSVVMTLIREFLRPMTFNDKVYYPQLDIQVVVDILSPLVKGTNYPLCASFAILGVCGDVLSVVKPFNFRANVSAKLSTSLQGVVDLVVPCVESLEPVDIFVCDTKVEWFRSKVVDPLRLSYCCSLTVCDLTQFNELWPMDNFFEVANANKCLFIFDSLCLPAPLSQSIIDLEQYKLRNNCAQPTKPSIPVQPTQKNNPGNKRRGKSKKTRAPPQVEPVPEKEDGPPDKKSVSSKKKPPYG
jgi:hypothetical protein